MKKTGGLNKIFRLQAIKWGGIGFALTALLSVLVMAYFAKLSSEKQISVLVSSVTTAYRQMILEGDIRSAQLQMAKALKLDKQEIVEVLDENLKPILSPSSHEVIVCTPSQTCWSKNLRFIETLYPVYFDENMKSLFGYVRLKVYPVVDFNIIFSIITFIFLGFSIQAFGLSSALLAVSQSIGSKLTSWTEYLRTGSDYPNHIKNREGISLQTAADNFENEIEKIKLLSAEKAKAAAQFSILKELGHDLKTPISQLDKFLSVLVSRVQSGKNIDNELIQYIQKALARTKDIASQTGILVYEADGKNQCDLKLEVNRIIDEFNHDEEVLQKKILIKLDKVENNLPLASVTATAYYRIVTNLIRNAIHAVSKHGEIQISLLKESGCPVITIKDNGSGIPVELQTKIFDFDFTTKPSRGTGMGLGIVKKLCGVFDAKLTFESKVHQGTKFKVVFQSRSDVA